MSNPKPPIIILGMHRSGTTMVTQMLEKLGLFVGVKKEVNNEAFFFYNIHNWIFRICFARADMPHNLKYLNPTTKNIIIDSLKYYLKSYRRISFLGIKKFFKYKSIADLDIPWGWKDPKNTYTIALWKEIFPEAKIVHIYRNPIDSISSFIHRDLEVKNKYQLNWKKRLKRFFLISYKFHPNFRLHSLEEGYNLWEEYVSHALDLDNTENEILHIKYEDFILNSEKHLVDLCAFCGLKEDKEIIDALKNTIKIERGFAFKKDTESLSVYNKIKDTPLMKKLGYDIL